MRTIFTFFLFILSFSVSAQLKQGDWNINTSTNAPMNLKLRSNGPGYRTYDFGVNPNIGYFIKDRWEIGGGPSLTFSGSKYKSGGPAAYSFKNNNSEIGLNLYTRYYFKSKGKLVPYLTANISYARGNGSSIDITGVKSKYSYNAWQAGGGVGVSWFIAPKVALFSELTYASSWGSGLGYTDGLNFKIGFQIFLNRKKPKK
jgi:hypothetical protein